jgi:hypothetical protein
MAHTPGPVKAIFVGNQTSRMTEIARLWTWAIESTRRKHNQEANARRFSAAWNAVEGISTEALEAGKLQRRLAAAEWLAASVIDLLHEAAGYDASWSVPQFLADEPAVVALKRALAEWQAANGGEHAE